jgi:UDP-N-acetylmuramate--alanine ligase
MIKKIKKIHFVGIGGIGMSGLAEIMLQQGFTVSGSDRTPSDITRHLQSLGIKVFEGHDANNVDCDLMIYTAAVREDNPELAEAGRKGIPMIKRAALLGEYLRSKKGISIAGTHGKTTTTAMIGMMLERAKWDPTIFAGGVIKDLRGNCKLGKSEWVVAEADEYDRSFLELHSFISVINNIESDHLDCYKDLNDIQNGFVQFANQTSIFGCVVINADEPSVLEVLPRINKRIVTYGLSEKSEIRATGIEQKSNTLTFDLSVKNIFHGKASLNLVGRHNVMNALACIGVGLELGIDAKVIVDHLRTFQGTLRRFENIGSVNGITVIDDYAHHPTEIRVTLKGAREGWPHRRIVAVFQPHLYSRTRDYFSEFAQAFAAADAVILTEIYAARESAIAGITGRMLFEEIKKHHAEVYYVEDKDKLASEILKVAQTNDLVIMMGAGDITQVGRKLVQNQN